MKELTQSQKAQAFDALVEWLEAEHKKMGAEAAITKTNLGKTERCSKTIALGTVILKAQEIASQLSAQPEQAENMPPPNLDLSQHVGKTAVLWSGIEGKISESYPQEKRDGYPFMVGNERVFVYTQNGFYYSHECEHTNNIKTILP